MLIFLHILLVCKYIGKYFFKFLDNIWNNDKQTAFKKIYNYLSFSDIGGYHRYNQMYTNNT